MASKKADIFNIAADKVIIYTKSLHNAIFETAVSWIHLARIDLVPIFKYVLQSCVSFWTGPSSTAFNIVLEILKFWKFR